MIIVFDGNGNRITDHGTNSMYPDGVPYEPKVGEYIYRLHDESDKVVVDKIMSSATVEATIANGEITGVTCYKYISVTVDKLQILADGTDTTTITATVDDTTSTETIELYNGATLVDSKPCVAGSATFLVTMTAPGTLTLTVKSTTKYGQRDVTITGV
jgi:hypothetical protein